MLAKRLGAVVCATCVLTLLVVTCCVVKLTQEGPAIRSLTDRSAKKLRGSDSVSLDVLSTGLINDSSYIITQSFGGQMTRAIRNMMVQQCWGASFGHPSYLVEPFSSNSFLYHTSRLWSKAKRRELRNAPRFSEFYDLDHYNFQSRRQGSIELVTWEHFIKNAPRQAVALVIPQQKCNLTWKRKTSNNRLLSNCSLSEAFQDFIVGLKTYEFHVIKVMCVDCTRLEMPLTPKELQSELYEGHSFQRVTILVNAWRNYAYTTSWLQLPKLCALCETPSMSVRLRPSMLVRRHTQYYKEAFLKHHGFVAVMIRIERFLTQQVSGRVQSNLSSCVNETLQVLDKTKTEMKNVDTFLTLDVGRFGSRVMRTSNAVSRLTSHGTDTGDTITLLAENTIKHVFNGTLSFKEWEDTFTDASHGITEMGYIAMLQRNIATEANCLILMGGGSFQQVAAYQYIQNHPNDYCLHTICVTQSFVKLFKEYIH